jgi:hypothetical protein
MLDLFTILLVILKPLLQFAPWCTFLVPFDLECVARAEREHEQYAGKQPHEFGLQCAWLLREIKRRKSGPSPRCLTEG